MELQSYCCSELSSALFGCYGAMQTISALNLIKMKNMLDSPGLHNLGRNQADYICQCCFNGAPQKPKFLLIHCKLLKSFSPLLVFSYQQVGLIVLAESNSVSSWLDSDIFKSRLE